MLRASPMQRQSVPRCWRSSQAVHATRAGRLGGAAAAAAAAPAPAAPPAAGDAAAHTSPRTRRVHKPRARKAKQAPAAPPPAGQTLILIPRGFEAGSEAAQQHAVAYCAARPHAARALPLLPPAVLQPAPEQQQQQHQQQQQQQQQQQNIPPQQQRPQQHHQQQASLPAWAAAVQRRVQPPASAGSTQRSRAARHAAGQPPVKVVSFADITSGGARRFTTMIKVADTSTYGSRRSSSSRTRPRGAVESGLRGSSSSSSAHRPLPPGDVTQQAALALQQQGGQLSADAEAQLCEAYQHFLALPQLLQGTPEELRHDTAAPAAAAAAVAVAATQADSSSMARMDDAGVIEQEGLLAAELLVQLYQPLLLSRVQRVQQQLPGANVRELYAAARRALLAAAGRFERQRVQGGMRLGALADRYIRNALRDLQREYRSAVSVPHKVLELRTQLLKVQRQLLQQQQAPPSLAQVAAAAGVSVDKAQQALGAAGTALQMTMLQPVSEQPECDKHMRGAAASGRLDLASMDVSMDEGGELDLSTTSAGGLRAARAGLHDQQGAAQDAEALEALLHEFMARLSPADRVTLSFALGNRSAAAAAAEQGLSRQASHAALQRVVRKLRAQLQAAAASDAEVAALLKQ